MSTNFNLINPNLIAMEEALNAEDVTRLRKYMNNWNFFNGYHWEDMPQTEKPEVTENWCRKFVDKFVETEFNSGFSLKLPEEAEEIILPFLNEVWEDNARERTLHELGQMKAVTGDSYLHILYEPKFINGQPNPNFEDPFDLYENGRIRLVPIPSSICFPRYKDGYDMYAMESCVVVFPIKRESVQQVGVLGNANTFDIIKYVYTKELIQVYKGGELIAEDKNPYGIIPIVHFKNRTLSGAHFGISDLEDVIPINVELNLKNSDTSEILDYHSSPITAVFGARVGQLEKGANKVWGGLPKDAKIQNITLDSDLGASRDYTAGLRKSMFQIGSIPEIAMGGDLNANISGVALSIAFMPLTDSIKTKWKCTKEAIKLTNNIVLKIGITEKLIDTTGLKPRQIYSQEVLAGDLLPKDLMIELQQMQQELKMGLESRKNMMKRLKKGNIEQLIKEIDSDRVENCEIYGVVPIALSAGQKLINPIDGSEIASNDKDAENLEMQGDQQLELADKNAETQIQQAKVSANSRPVQQKSKPVGINSEGKTAKVNSGVTNTNPKTTK